MADQNARASDGRKSALLPAVSRTFADGTLIELLYRASDGKTAFAIWRDGEVTIESEFIAGHDRLVPFSPRNNVIKNDVVLLPSEPREYGSKAELLDHIRAFLHRYLDVAPDFERIAAHYVLFTWVYDAFHEVPYLRFQGDFGTGKTRALLVLGSICCRAFFASGASTVSPVFHILDAFRGTLVLDEADFRFSDEKSEIVKILNNGNVSGIPVLRTMQNHKREFDPRAFHVFGPKVVAMRGSYRDRALESRFMTEVMGKAPLRRDIPLNLTGRMREEAQHLRNKLLLFRFRHRNSISSQSAPQIRGVAARINQIVLPLLGIVDDLDTRRALVGFARSVHGHIIADRAFSCEAQLLEVIRELTASEPANTLAITDIRTRFIERFGSEYTRPITPRWIGSLLRQRLHLAPYKSHGRYVLPVFDKKQLAVLYARFGITEGDARDPGGALESAGGDGEVGIIAA